MSHWAANSSQWPANMKAATENLDTTRELWPIDWSWVVARLAFILFHMRWRKYDSNHAQFQLNPHHSWKSHMYSDLMRYFCTIFEMSTQYVSNCENNKNTWHWQNPQEVPLKKTFCLWYPRAAFIMYFVWLRRFYRWTFSGRNRHLSGKRRHKSADSDNGANRARHVDNQNGLRATRVLTVTNYLMGWICTCPTLDFDPLSLYCSFHYDVH